MKKEINIYVLPCLILSLVFLGACGEYEPPPERPTSYEISGRVVNMMSADQNNMDPIDGAIVQLEDGSARTVTDEKGFWKLTVPSEPNPFLKITHGSYIDSYNTIPLNIGITQFDLMALPSLTYYLFLFLDGVPFWDWGNACIMMGAASGFVGIEYPQKMAMLEDVAIKIDPPELKVRYVDSNSLVGFNPDLLATGPDGAFMVVIPDATKTTSVTVSGSKPGNNFMSMKMETRPGAFIPAGVIDLFYNP